LLDYATGVAQHIIVPEPDDAVALGFHVSRARSIIFDCFGMLPAIQFNDEPFGQAGEIREVRPDGHLPAPLVAGQT
jgi:hypothetical protein